MITELGNTLITLMLARFLFNDLPHSAGLLANSQYERPPTSGQLSYIASLCQRLGMQRPYEEEVKSFGEAGRMIRELEAERDFRKSQKKRLKSSGNPGISTPVIGFTGTRKGMTSFQKAEVKSTLSRLHPKLVRHGDCIGADAEFHTISIELGVPVWLHPSTLSGQRAYSQGAIGSEFPKEPLERNRDIVNMSDILLATPGESTEVLRSGTWATIRYAKKTGRKLLVIYPERSYGGTNPRLVMYHATLTSDVSSIQTYGIHPQPLRSDVASIVGFSNGVYLANSAEAAKDLGRLKYGEDRYTILSVQLPVGTLLKVDPEIGEPDSPWFITPNFIPAESILTHSGRLTPTGTCYEDAWRFLIKQEEGFLIHGSAQLLSEAPRINHAWVELPSGWVWEPQTKSYYTIEDFRIMSPIEEHRYTVEQAAIMAARTSNMGPWSDEERAEWLKLAGDSRIIEGMLYTAPLQPLEREYMLLAYREGYTMGNVWELSDDPEVVARTVKDVFGEYGGADNIPSLFQGNRIYLRPNPYNATFIQVIRRSEN